MRALMSNDMIFSPSIKENVYFIYGKLIWKLIIAKRPQFFGSTKMFVFGIVEAKKLLLNEKWSQVMIYNEIMMAVI